MLFYKVAVVRDMPDVYSSTEIEEIGDEFPRSIDRLWHVKLKYNYQ